MRRLAITVAFVFGAGGMTAQASDPEQVVRELMAGFNAHDAARMATVVAADVEVFYMSENGVPELGTDGREQLVEQMTAYFDALPDVRSEVEAIIPGPVYVSVRERIVGGAASLAVYEVRENLVRRVWYYPVDAPPAPPGARPGSNAASGSDTS